MKTFKNMAAQGDFVIIRVDSIPEGLEEIKVTNTVVVAHSETGHDHVMVLERPGTVQAFKDSKTSEVDLYEMFLLVSEPTPIEHKRAWDTHETLLVPPGRYKIRRQREYIPQGFRRAAD
jgi:hypothetical protein